MKSQAGSSAHSEYPHIVVKYAPRSLTRLGVAVDTGHRYAAIEPHALVRHPRPFDAAGSLTAEARELLIVAAAAAMGETPYPLCLVWGPNDCTFVDGAGGRVDSDHPPYVRPFYVHLGADLPPLALERFFSIKLPAGKHGAERYLCAQRIGRLVEIVEGESMVLGHLPDEDILADSEGIELPQAEILRMLPKTYRGAQVTGYIAGALLGPIQPMELATPIILQDPWPEEVARACEQVAAHPLPASVTKPLWDAVRHRRPALLRAA
ncbi:MAG: hypothetical protein QOG72_1056 [Sphingomonadales bacterium]|jgi:hypothetical protein|nr:hypothetical protein [Sphingomonadales bacterium]